MITALNLKRSQMYYQLRKLMDLALVEKPKRGLYQVTARMEYDQLNAWVSEATGKAGKGDKRRQQHQEERQRYASKKLIWARQGQEGEAFPLAHWRCSKCGYGQWFPVTARPGLCTRCHEGFFERIR